jgi:hypothetical protein
MIYFIFPCVLFVAIAAYILCGKADEILRELKAIRERLDKT